jgi:hypothetical protein
MTIKRKMMKAMMTKTIAKMMTTMMTKTLPVERIMMQVVIPLMLQ